MRAREPPLAGEAFVKVQLEGCADAADVVARACAEFSHWGVNRGQVALFRVPGGRVVALAVEGTPALAAGILVSANKLAPDEAVLPGSWLLARVPPPPPPGALP